VQQPGPADGAVRAADAPPLPILDAGGFAANVDAFAWEEDPDPAARRMRLWFVSLLGSQQALKAIWARLVRGDLVTLARGLGDVRFGALAPEGPRAWRAFTASLPAAAILTGRPGIDLFVFGGAVRGADGSLAGETTLAMIGRFRFDYAVLGYSGFDEDGALMDFDLEKVAVKQQAIARSAHVLAVGDSSKFARRAMVRVAPPGAGSTIVTDAISPADRKRFVTTFGYRVEKAGGP
jgi:DeoR family glycerol-3-phosphate regulon repressor